MSTKSIPCPVCSKEAFENLIDFGKVPRSGVFLSRPDEAFGTIQLSFEYCSRCALLRQRPRADDSHDYTRVSRSTARQLPAYAVHLAGSLRQHGISTGDLIVEVGANDGSFMDVLTAAGFTNLIGIEPSEACAGVSIGKGHKIEMSHLDEAVSTTLRERHGTARAVICRHTLEHVPDPLGLVSAMKSLLSSDGLLFIEVPNSQAILQDLRGHELWDEHLHIFTPENLAMLAQRAGFSVTDIVVWPHCDTTNILLWARLRTPEAEPSRDCSRDVGSCRQFEKLWTALRGRMAGDLSESPKPVAVIGASHPQSNYLLFMGLGEYVDYLVDDDPCKAGHYAPIPKPAPIIYTAQFLAGKPPGTVIRAAFGYEDWMDRMLAPLITRSVRIVRPYATPFIVPT